MQPPATHPGPWILNAEVMSPAARIMLGLAGLAPLWGFYDLIIRHWPSPFGLILVGVVALGVAVICFGSAIIGPSRTVTIDSDARTITDAWASRVLPGGVRTYDFADVRDIKVSVQSNSDGPDVAHLWLHLASRGRPVSLLKRPATDQADVENLMRQLQDAVRG